MFVREEDIRSALQLYGIPYERVEYIPIGVMTDKFVYGNAGKKFIARCYPEERGFLAEAEFGYMQRFRERGILCPWPVKIIDVGQNLCLIYERLEGQMLSDVYDGMSEVEKDKICREIASNYKRISEIACSGFGRMLGYEKFAHGSMSDMIGDVVCKAEGWIMQYGSMNPQAKNVLDRFKERARSFLEMQPVLVWSDLGMDNIIVDERGRLVGFLDFEGLMGADVNLGIGYLQAHENNSDFVTRLIKMIPGVERGKVDCYAMMRYLRILPYTHLPLPNGTKRDNLNYYMSYVQNIS